MSTIIRLLRRPRRRHRRGAAGRVAARPVATIAVAEATAAATAGTVIAPVVAVALLEHRRRAFLELLDLDGQPAENVLVDALLALHLGDRRGRRVDVHQREVRLAVLADAVGEGLEAPGLDLGDLAAALLDDAP